MIGEDKVDEEKLYQELFDQNSHVDVKLDISDEELQKLEDDYEKYDKMKSESPIYRKADMSITVNDKKYVISDVGVRMKGNTSKTDFYSKKSGIYSLTNLKVSFGQTLLGL